MIKDAALGPIRNVSHQEFIEFRHKSSKRVKNHVWRQTLKFMAKDKIHAFRISCEFAIFAVITVMVLSRSWVAVSSSARASRQSSLFTRPQISKPIPAEVYRR